MSLTTAAAISLGVKAVSAATNFYNASQTDDLLEESNKAAAEYLQSAKSRIEKDFYAGLNVPTSAFETELLSNLQATTTAVEALSEAGSRELLGGIGKVQAVQQMGAEAARIQQEEQLFELDKFKAGKQDEINQQMLQLEVTAERDRQKRIRDAEEDRATYMTQGFTDLGSAAATALEQSDLMKKSKDDRQLAKFLKENNITPQAYAADPEKYAEDVRVVNMTKKEKRLYNAEMDNKRRLGAEADEEFRKKQYDEQMAAAASIIPQTEGEINIQQSPLMQSLFPSVEETMAKYGITLPKQPKTYTITQ